MMDDSSMIFSGQAPIIVFVFLVLFELLTPSILLDFNDGQPAEPEQLGHTGAHDSPELLCNLPAGNDVRRYELVAQAADWEIAPDHVIQIWTFNGSVPGPTICARVGDRLEITLTNRLSTIASFHVHGLHLYSHSDGTLLSHPLVPPRRMRSHHFASSSQFVRIAAYPDSVA